MYSRPYLSIRSIHWMARPVQKSAAVLGLEKVLSESIVQMPLFKVAYSSTILSLFAFHVKEGTQLLATMLPFNTVNPAEL